MKVSPVALKASFAMSLALVSLSGAAPARAEDESPVIHDLWFDAELRPSPQNAAAELLTEGDSLVIHLDSTRLFPDAKTPLFGLGFSVDRVPASVRGFYVAAGGSGSKNPLSMQQGSCGITAHETQMTAKVASTKTALDEARKDVEAKKGASPAEKDAAQALAEEKLAEWDTAKAEAKKPFLVAATDSGPCEPALDWRLADEGLVPYLCHGDKSLAELMEASAEWSLVQGVDGSDQVQCLQEWTLTKQVKITSATVEVVHGGNAAEAVQTSSEKGLASATVAIKSNTRRVIVTHLLDTGIKARLALDFKVQPRDTRSRLRVQAELLATNRLRTVSFAVALTPVRRKFLTSGPEACSFGETLGCRITMSALLRIAGDDKTVVQFGGALGYNFVRSFQVNAGLLFGTTDNNIAWRLERNWFVGIAVDPLILSDAIATGSRKD